MPTLTPEFTCTRERSRLQYLAAVEMTTGDGSKIRGNLRDIGIDGIFVKTDYSYKDSLASAMVDIALIVTQGKSRLTIGTPGRIIREDIDGYAVKFSEPLKWWPIFSLFPVNDSFMFDIVSKT